MFIIFLT